MKKVIIISPHFPPSNLAAVHRSRLFAQHLPLFGWQPIILTVDEKYYEETPDHNLVKLLPADLRIEKVNAIKITNPRIIGDIGLRAFFQLLKKTISLIKKEKIDFLYIPIPSFYVALIGRIAHHKTGVPYGIDYIDPWVHSFAGSENIFSRHWWSTKLSQLLEPLAVKKAKLITGVAEEYYDGVISRNPHLKKQAVFTAMPYGGEIKDHQKVKELSIRPYLFESNENKVRFVYAGAMLPKAFGPLEAVFKSIKEHVDTFINTELIFIGTGKRTNDPLSYSIKALAEKYEIWQSIVFEHPKRIPYLDVLAHLNHADAVFILGSTEPHYTPSKVYQGVLSHKPVLAILHNNSSAKTIIENSAAGIVLAFNGENDLNKITENFQGIFERFMDYKKSYGISKINYSLFNEYSAQNMTALLANSLDKVLND